MPEDLDAMREAMARRASPRRAMDDEQIRSMMEMMGDLFRDGAPMTAAQAATVILDAVKAGEWRILVGDDAHRLDEAVRADPLAVYGEGGLSLGILGGWPYGRDRSAAQTSRLLVAMRRGWAVGDGEGGGEGGAQLVGGRHGEPGGAAELGVGGEVGVDEVGLPDRAEGAELLAADLGQLAVVEHDVGERELVLHRGGELGEVLPEAAVAADRDDLAAGVPPPRRTATDAPMAAGRAKPIEPR